jgi:hypothetical protein
MNLPNICEDGEGETGWTGKETAARIQNDRVTLARLEQRRGYTTGVFFPVGTATKRGTIGGSPGSKKTSDSRRGCQNKLIDKAPKFRITYLSLFII